jgi:hypothetical protein
MVRHFINWTRETTGRQIFFIFLLLLICAGLFRLTQRVVDLVDDRTLMQLRWWRGDSAQRDELMSYHGEACPGAPFILPTDGYVGLYYGDPRGPYSRTNPHQGIDIFSPDSETPGLVPVYAAYDGYITRESDWVSSLIQRIPDDPLNPGRQIWLYYTHMADDTGMDLINDRFPQGTDEYYVEQGSLLGYTGNVNGQSARNIWVHLHFSIIRDDGLGNYTNELDFTNSIDPSPYLGMPISYSCAETIGKCGQVSSCQ